ncbi:MAG: NPCBM/NEW2 domain-containing protein [Planctomycetota bacterium]|jgi:Gpi18-like mannosyltransferase
MTLVLIAGSVARAVLSMRDGHLADVNVFLSWMRGLVEHGFGGFHEAYESCNYPPFYLLVLRGLGELLALFDPNLAQGEALRAWLRAPACIADVSIALILFVEARRLIGPRAGVVAAALYFLNPVSLYNSAYWGQMDSVHSAFVLAAVVALNRQRPSWAGVAIGLALLQKLQAIVFVPLVLFDVYRWKRWGGVTRCLIGALAAAVAILAPYAATRSIGPALAQGYDVLGQYNRLSVNAFNLWHMTGSPRTPGDSVPTFLVETAGGGEVSVADDAGWIMWLTWRRLAMFLFVLLVALTLTLYSRRHTPTARALAAGVLGMIFFLFLTEMHERYAYPVVALLPLWAIAGPWRERAYVLLSILLLLNLTAVQNVDQIGGDIAGLNLVLCGVFLLGLLVSGRDVQRPLESESELGRVNDQTKPPPRSALLRWFGRSTLAAWAGALLAAGFVAYQHSRIDRQPEAGVLYLGELTPVRAKQGYGRLTVDRSVEGGVIHLGNRYYRRGLGTHAPATVVYDLPDGYRTFRAVLGLDRHFGGTARAQVYLDEAVVFTSRTLRPGDEPAQIDVPLDGAKRLKLQIQPAGSSKGDHVDWALARLEK